MYSKKTAVFSVIFSAKKTALMTVVSQFFKYLQNNIFKCGTFLE